VFSRAVGLRRSEVARGLAIALTLACIAGGIVGCGRGERGETELQRLLAYLPPVPEQPSLNEVVFSFSDLAELKRLHGFEEDLTLERVPKSLLPEFLEAVGSAGVCASLDAHIRTSHTRMDVGYDVTAMKWCIEGGGVTLMGGEFDQRHVAVSLEGLGYNAGEYRGVTTYHFNAETYTGDETGRGLAEMAGHVAVLKGAVITAATSERLHAALDAHSGRVDSLSSAPQYAALARALGPAVSARFLSTGGQVVGMGYRETAHKERSVTSARPGPCAGRDAPALSWKYHETVQRERYIVLASTYATAEEAEAAGERLIKSLETHTQADDWQEIGEPAITDFEGGAMLTITLELENEAPGGIPEELASVWP
jgi:hypothetical protein